MEPNLPPHRPRLVHELSILEKRGQPYWIAVSVLLILLIFVVDVTTAHEVSFSLFYAIPIVLTTWFAGRPLGVGASIASAVAWFIADAISGPVYSHPLIRYWNAATRLAFFLMATFFLPLLQALEREKELARRDYLTGAANRLFFFEAVQRELLRSQRYDRPFTIAFADIDNFKAINDRFGHSVGDQVLCRVVARAMANLRKSDLIARLGGDEFAFFLPETDPAAAKSAVTKLQSALLDEMLQKDWPVTLSIGALTCTATPGTMDELMKRVDDLLYSAKHRGKNTVTFDVYAG